MRWRCSGIGYWSEAMLAPVQQQPSSKRRRSIVQRRSLLRWPRTPGSRVFHLHRCFSWRCSNCTAPVALFRVTALKPAGRLLTSFWSTNPGVAQRMRSKPKRLRSIQGFATGLSKILPTGSMRVICSVLWPMAALKRMRSQERQRSLWTAPAIAISTWLKPRRELCSHSVRKAPGCWLRKRRIRSASCIVSCRNTSSPAKSINLHLPNGLSSSRAEPRNRYGASRSFIFFI